MYKILIILFFNILLSQSINHEPIKNIKENSDIKIEVFIDLQASEIKTFELYYKNSSQDGYFKQNFFSDDNLYFYSNIPSNFAPIPWVSLPTLFGTFGFPRFAKSVFKCEALFLSSLPTTPFPLNDSCFIYSLPELFTISFNSLHNFFIDSIYT